MIVFQFCTITCIKKIIGNKKGKQMSMKQVINKLWVYLKDLQDPEIRQSFTPYIYKIRKRKRSGQRKPTKVNPTTTSPMSEEMLKKKQKRKEEASRKYEEVTQNIYKKEPLFAELT